MEIVQIGRDRLEDSDVPAAPRAAAPEHESATRSSFAKEDARGSFNKTWEAKVLRLTEPRSDILKGCKKLAGG